MLRSVNDDLGLTVSRVYSTPYERGKVYMAQMGQSTGTVCKEHTRHLCLYQPNKSIVAEHNTHWNHHINFKDTEVLAKTVGYMDQLVQEK
jgi:hypothetical protein